MTDKQTDTAPGVEPITDHESLRGRVPFHEETDVVPAETVESLAAAENMAIVGVTNDAGEVLLRRLTPTCSWKLPVALVDEGEEYAAAIREHVTETVGGIDLRAVEGVWHVDARTEDGAATATRAFVVFSGTLDEETIQLPADGVEEAGWFDELPEEAGGLPGTELFL